MRKKYTYHWIVIVTSVFIEVAFFVFSSYKFNWTWTGFPHKSLWDWMQLFIIPLVLVGIGIIYNRVHDQTAHNNTLDNQRETALQVYFDRMSELLLEKNLDTESNALSIAQARTMTTLRILDPIRRASLIQFLSESSLIQMGIGKDLKGLDLHGVNLDKVNLRGVSLGGSNLSGARLSEIDLSEADLSDSNLSYAYLNRVKLNKANLSRANLKEANMDEVDMRNAGLIGTILKGTRFFNSDMSKANLILADLTNAKLIVSDLIEAKLRDAKLRKTVLYEVNLVGTLLTQEQKKEAKISQSEAPKKSLTEQLKKDRFKSEDEIIRAITSKAQKNKPHENI